MGNPACDLVALSLVQSVIISHQFSRLPLLQFFLVLRLPRPGDTFLEINAPLLGVPNYYPLIA